MLEITGKIRHCINNREKPDWKVKQPLNHLEITRELLKNKPQITSCHSL